MKQACLLWILPLLASCQGVVPPPAPISPAAAQGHVLAQSSCGGCHSVGPVGTSSNSNAPPFPVIVNQEGLTAETLSVWLKGAHNYPSEMDFSLSESEVDKLVAYMLTLRDPNYKRPPD